jgi:hypothetical protein
MATELSSSVITIASKFHIDNWNHFANSLQQAILTDIGIRIPLLLRDYETSPKYYTLPKGIDTEKSNSFFAS